ncbi:uncharacterized protein LOC120488418 isoform X2 [Pimephales promelas]|uniref:uncharacterized protein LOC120488418 isoform X2 n=1 Tax=Pimephales promelas TaxID=90988 RepID=UPI001955CABA|nr:uncharacterized protein LOC120488418 isoform X2 [Pimephales promelas]
MFSPNQEKTKNTAMEDLKNKKVCSLHFKKEDFELNVLGMKRVALLNTAIPSVFTFPEDEDQPEASGSSSAKRTRLETQTVSAPALVSSENGEQSLITSPPVKKLTPVQTAVVSPCPSASSIEVCPVDESNQPESTNPPTSSSSSSSEEEEEEGGVQDRHEKKIIVKKSSFASIFKFCQTCGKPNTF